MIKGWQKILAKIAKLLYEGKLKGDISPEMVKAHANYLFEAVDTNVPKSIADKDTAMMFNMRRNVFHFSGAKNWQQLQEMSRLIKDIQGNARPFNEFLKDVKTIDKTYNATYLKAEYGLATRSAKNAAKWSRFQSEKELFPNLRYEAVGDARTRPEHAALDGIVKPIDHPFWKKYFPPNGWNCRCTVQQEDIDTPVTPNNETPIPENVPPVMQGNAGIDGVIFSNKHPYFETIPKAYLEKVKKQSLDLIE
jgi:SPP1 gp7 family putative phage head morphogenesis protein